MYANTCTEYVRNESYSCVGYDLLTCSWFCRKSFSDFGGNRFPILKKIVLWFFRDFFAILKKIVFWFIRKSFLIFSRFYSDFEENRFLIFSWFLETRFIKLICIRKNTEKIVCKSRDFNTILSTIYSTIFLVWVMTVNLRNTVIQPVWSTRIHKRVPWLLTFTYLKRDSLEFQTLFCLHVFADNARSREINNTGTRRLLEEGKLLYNI